LKLTFIIFYTSLVVAVSAQGIHYALREWRDPIIPGFVLGVLWGLAAWKNRHGLNTLLFLCMVIWCSLGLAGNNDLLLPLLSGTCIVAAWNSFDFLYRLRKYGIEASNTRLAKQYAWRLAIVSVVALALGSVVAVIKLQLRFELVMLLVILGFIGLSQLVRYLLHSHNTP
jgi:hypothetical protein